MPKRRIQTNGSSSRPNTTTAPPPPITSIMVDSRSDASLSGIITTEANKKVNRKIYSKLAFFVTRVKSKEDTDDASISSSDSTLSSHGLLLPLQETTTQNQNQSSRPVVFDFGECKEVIEEIARRDNPRSTPATTNKKKLLFERKKKKRTASQQNYCGTTTTCCGDKSRQKAKQKKYSKIAFSVQNVGSVQIKSKKKGRNVRTNTNTGGGGAGPRISRRRNSERIG